MEEISGSLRDMLNQKKGTISEIDYCMSKGSSGGRSHHDETSFDKLNSKYSKFASCRLNSLEIAIDQPIQIVTLSSNNSPNRKQEEITGRPPLFPSSTKQHADIKFPDQLSEVMSKSEHTETPPRSEYLTQKQGDGESGTGSPDSKPALSNDVSPVKLSRSAISDDDHCIYGLPYVYASERDPRERSIKSKHLDCYYVDNRNPVTSEGELSAGMGSHSAQGNCSSAMTSENQVSAPSFLVMTDQNSVSRRIEKMLQAKNYIEKPGDHSKEDLVTKIEGVLHKVESNSRLKNDRILPKISEIESRNKFPRFALSPMLIARQLDMELTTGFAKAIDSKKGDFREKSQEEQPIAQSASQSMINNIHVNNKDDVKPDIRSMKKRDSATIQNLISLCNEKLQKFKKSKSPVEGSAMRKTSCSSSVLDTLKNARRSRESGLNLPFQTNSRDMSPKASKLLFEEKYSMKVKRLSIIQRDSVPNTPSRQPVAAKGSKSREIKSPRAQGSQMINYLRTYLSGKNQKHRILDQRRSKQNHMHTSQAVDSSSSSFIKVNTSAGAIAIKYKANICNMSKISWSNKLSKRTADRQSNHREYYEFSKPPIQVHSKPSTPTLMKTINSKITRYTQLNPSTFSPKLPKKLFQTPKVRPSHNPTTANTSTPLSTNVSIDRPYDHIAIGRPSIESSAISVSQKMYDVVYLDSMPV